MKIKILMIWFNFDILIIKFNHSSIYLINKIAYLK